MMPLGSHLLGQVVNFSDRKTGKDFVEAAWDREYLSMSNPAIRALIEEGRRLAAEYEEKER